MQPMSSGRGLANKTGQVSCRKVLLSNRHMTYSNVSKRVKNDHVHMKALISKSASRQKESLQPHHLRRIVSDTFSKGEVVKKDFSSILRPNI
jgi:ribonuclease HIII